MVQVLKLVLVVACLAFALGCVSKTYPFPGGSITTEGTVGDRGKLSGSVAAEYDPVALICLMPGASWVFNCEAPSTDEKSDESADSPE